MQQPVRPYGPPGGMPLGPPGAGPPGAAKQPYGAPPPPGAAAPYPMGGPPQQPGALQPPPSSQPYPQQQQQQPYGQPQQQQQQQPPRYGAPPPQPPGGAAAPPPSSNGYGPPRPPQGFAAMGGPPPPMMGGAPAPPPPQSQQQPPPQQQQPPPQQQQQSMQQLTSGMGGMQLGGPPRPPMMAGGAPAPVGQPPMPGAPRPVMGAPPGPAPAYGAPRPPGGPPQMGAPPPQPPQQQQPPAYGAPPPQQQQRPGMPPPPSYGAPPPPQQQQPPPPFGAPPLPGGAQPMVGPPGAFGPPRPGMMPPPPGGPPGMMQQQHQQQQPGMMPPGPPGPPGMMQRPGMPPGPPGMPPPPGPPGAPPLPPGAPGAPPRMQAMSAAPPQQQQSRIDPSQIPRPPLAPQGGEPLVFYTRANGAHQHPPPSCANFVVRDCGSASPRLLRSTLNAVPATPELLSSSGMPFAAVVQPLAVPGPDDDPVPVVDFGDVGPVRCARCKAYINPYVRWADGGKTFVCNFCGGATPTPEPYFCYLGPDGRRRDADERPELSRGTYEVVATRDYMVRPPMPVAHVFLVDVSAAAVGSGATAAACQCIEQALDAVQGGDGARVGIATYDGSIHFYDVAPGRGAPSMLVVADTADAYAPLPAAGLPRLAECKEQLVDLLHTIPTMFAAAPRGPESCGAAAIEACIELLKPTGGKVHAFVATLPNSGARALKIRDHAGLAADRDKQLGLLPADSTYHTVATQAAEFQVCVDVFLLAQTYADAATLSVLPATTGGSLYRYCPFTPALDTDQLLNDLRWNVARPQGLEAILRVRASAGLDVDGYSGAYYRPPNSPTDAYLPAIDADKALLARINVVDKLSPGGEAYLQSALLYTSTDGARRIRVSTLALPVADAMGPVFKGADLDSQLVAAARTVAHTLPGATFAAARDAVVSRVIATLAAYRRFCATSSSAVQLILPEALKLLPLYALGALKGAALRPEAKADDRSLWLWAALTAGAPRIAGLLHGRLFPVHRLAEPGAMPPGPALPAPLPLSAEALEAGGVYLWEDGADALLFVDRGAPPSLVAGLFAGITPDELARLPAPVALPPPPASGAPPAAAALAELLARARRQRCAFMRLRVARKGDAAEAAFLGALVEDRGPGGMSYVEFLCHAHRQIQAKLGG